jgi:hypothetical protein
MPALDYRDNRTENGDREFTSGQGNDLLAIDYPTLALFNGRFSVVQIEGGVGQSFKLRFFYNDEFESRSGCSMRGWIKRASITRIDGPN